MSSYQVQRTPGPGISRLYLSVAAVVTTALMATGMPYFGTVSVSVDGREHTLPRGTRAHDLFEKGLVRTEEGDLIDVNGDVLERGGGEPVRLLENGQEVQPDAPVGDGDVYVSTGGSDVSEATVTSSSVIPIPVTYEGSGPFEQLSSPGSPGLIESVIGARSGIVVSTSAVREAEPMVITRLKPEGGERVIALTFDDGPWPTYTEQILGILDREDVKATFFMLGKQVRRNRDLAAKVAAAGHEIGNHSLSHVYMSGASAQVALSEIENCQAEIERTTGVTPTWFRPPGGYTSPAVWHQTRESKVKLITWTVDPQDYRCSSPVVLASRVIDSVEPGSVILLHDGGGNRECTVKALTTIIRELKDRGYTFVTLDEMQPAG